MEFTIIIRKFSKISRKQILYNKQNFEEVVEKFKGIFKEILRKLLRNFR